MKGRRQLEQTLSHHEQALPLSERGQSGDDTPQAAVVRLLRQGYPARSGGPLDAQLSRFARSIRSERPFAFPPIDVWHPAPRCRTGSLARSAVNDPLRLTL